MLGVESGREESGKQFTMYVIQVAVGTSTWEINRYKYFIRSFEVL